LVLRSSLRKKRLGYTVAFKYFLLSYLLVLKNALAVLLYIGGGRAFLFSTASST
jgi:hypothetical protein